MRREEQGKGVEKKIRQGMCEKERKARKKIRREGQRGSRGEERKRIKKG